jgi:hypothetical protein
MAPPAPTREKVAREMPVPVSTSDRQRVPERFATVIWYSPVFFIRSLPPAPAAASTHVFWLLISLTAFALLLKRVCFDTSSVFSTISSRQPLHLSASWDCACLLSTRRDESLPRLHGGTNRSFSLGHAHPIAYFLPAFKLLSHFTAPALSLPTDFGICASGEHVLLQTLVGVCGSKI